MSKIVILCVEDEPEVRDALVRDLEEFKPICKIEATEEAQEANEVIAECVTTGMPIALALVDHLLPGVHGVEFLVSMKRDPETEGTKKVLVTGQAGLEDTVKAINDADLDHYIAKPWAKEDLVAVVRKQLTDWVIENEDDLLPYVQLLDGTRLMAAMSGRGTDS